MIVQGDTTMFIASVLGTLVLIGIASVGTCVILKILLYRSNYRKQQKPTIYNNNNPTNNTQNVKP